MFTGGAFVLICLIGSIANRMNRKDPYYPDEPLFQIEIARHSRQDIRLLCYLLMGVIVMLGVIADKLH